MKYTKLLSQVGLASSLLSVSVGAFADVEVSKIAPIQHIFPNAYADFEMRSYQEVTDANDSVPKVQARYTLGSGFFDTLEATKKQRFVTELIFGANKFAGQDGVKNRGIRSESSFTLFSSTYASLVSHLEAKLPHEGHGTNAAFGFRIPVSADLSTGAGVITPEVGADIYALIGSRPRNIDVDTDALRGSNTNDMGLTEKEGSKGSYTAPSEVTSFENEYTAKITYVPNFVSGLTLYAKGYYRNTFTPNAYVSEDGKKVEYKKSGNRNQYHRVYSHEHRFQALYAVNDTVYLMNDFFLRDRNDAGRRQYENVFAVGAHLF